MGALPSAPGGALQAGLVLLALAGAATVLALVPRWRRRWWWGRGRDAYPISRGGCLGVVLALLVMASGPLANHLGRLTGDQAMLVVLGGFSLFVVTAFLDGLGAGPRAGKPGQNASRKRRISS